MVRENYLVNSRKVYWIFYPLKASIKWTNKEFHPSSCQQASWATQVKRKTKSLLLRQQSYSNLSTISNLFIIVIFTLKVFFFIYCTFQSDKLINIFVRQVLLQALQYKSEGFTLNCVEGKGVLINFPLENSISTMEKEEASPHETVKTSFYRDTPHFHYQLIFCHFFLIKLSINKNRSIVKMLWKQISLFSRISIIIKIYWEYSPLKHSKMWRFWFIYGKNPSNLWQFFMEEMWWPVSRFFK